MSEKEFDCNFFLIYIVHTMIMNVIIALNKTHTAVCVKILKRK